MASSFDRRIVGEALVEFLRACQARVPAHLGGGAALAGLHLRHRLSKDADLFVHDRAEHRVLVAALADIGRECEPLPTMLEPLTVADLRAYRDVLAARFRRLAVPG